MCHWIHLFTLLLLLPVEGRTSLNKPPEKATTTTPKSSAVTHPDEHYADITVKWMNDANTCDLPKNKMYYEIGPSDGMYVQAWHEPENRTVVMDSCRITVHSSYANDSLLYEFFGKKNHISCGDSKQRQPPSLSLYDSINALKPIVSVLSMYCVFYRVIHGVMPTIEE